MPARRTKADAPPDAKAAIPPALDRVDDVGKKNWPSAFEVLLGVGVSVSVDLGSAKMELGEILNLTKAGLIVLNQQVGEPVLIRLNGVPYARGEVVEVSGRYGVKVVEMHSQGRPAP